ncbi:membrane protein [Nitrospira sp.]|nr:membrane protein [Nitrospira sp.]
MLARILRLSAKPGRASRVPLGASHAAIALATVMFGWAASGCVPLVVGAAGGVAGAVYVMGKLTDELPHDVPTVHRATVLALKDLDLTPSEDRVDKLSAHVESVFADGERVWIDLDTVMDSHTSLTIRVGLTGNETRARRIHDAIKRHLPGGSTPS